MGFSFLTPLFALAALAVAVPVLVHLVHKERKETTPFPSLMFLRRTPYQHSRRQRIRDWLLFALRALAVLLLVAAFTRPVFSRAKAATPGGLGSKESVILVDQSFSMRYGDRWSKALDAAHRAMDDIGVNDRATVVVFDDQARAVNEATNDHTRLRTAIDSVKPADGSTRYAPAFAIARRVLAASNLPRRELVVITDFQRSGWDLTQESQLPAGTDFKTVDVASGDIRDHAVRAVELRREGAGGSERIAVSARVSNAGPTERGLEARLEVGGRIVQTTRVDLAANGGGLVTFPAVPVPAAPQRAAVRIAADGLAEDDAFYFILERTPAIDVLVIEDAAANDERDLYLRRALEIGDRPAFNLSVRRPGQLSPNDLSGKKVVVLNDAVLAGDAGRRLEAFVRGGGGVVVALGEASGPTAWTRSVPGLLPAPPSAVTDRVGERGAVLGFLDHSHPVLALFGVARSGDLSAARFFRYRPIATDSGVIARFDDGTVALAEHRLGRGRVLAWASTFDAVWSDLPRQPVFLPFLHQLVQYAGSYHDQKDVYEVGEAVDLTTAGSVRGGQDSSTGSREAFVAVAPSGTRLRIGGEGGAAALLPREAGIYEVRRAGAPGEAPRLIAVNPATRELEFARFDPTRLTNAVSPPPGSTAAPTSGAAPDPAARERDQSLWWYLLLIVTCLLVGESLLADRISRRRPAAI